MIQNGIFVEPDFQVRFEAACFNEGLLTQEDYVYSDIHTLPPAYKNMKASQIILPYISLYPHLHCTTSEIDISNIPGKTGLDVTMLDPEFVRLSSYASIAHSFDDGSDIRKAFNRALEYAHDESFMIFLEKKNHLLKIIPSLISEKFTTEAIELSDHASENSCRILFGKLFEIIIDRLFEYYRFDLTGSILRSSFLEEDLKISGRLHPLAKHPYFEALLLQVEHLYLRTVAEVFECSLDERGGSLTQRFGYINEMGGGRIKALDSIAGIDFGVRILPDPRNICEAVELAHTKPVARLRELMDRWTAALYDGDGSMEAQIRKDIVRANGDMKNLKRIRAYKDSPFGLAFRFVGGNVPIVSNILSISELLIFFAERRLETRSCWLSVHN